MEVLGHVMVGQVPNEVGEDISTCLISISHLLPPVCSDTDCHCAFGRIFTLNIWYMSCFALAPSALEQCLLYDLVLGTDKH